MKQPPQPQDAQFSQPAIYPYQSDEISLVDLAKTLVKRWKFMAAIFVVIAAAGFAYALTMSAKYEYVSIYHAAEKSVGAPLESIEGLQSKTNSIYIPVQIRALLQQQNLLQLPFDVSVSSPKDTNLIILSSKAEESASDLVGSLHSSIIEQLKAEQDKQVAKHLAMLQTRLDSTKKQLEILEKSDSPKAGELAANVMTTISELESEIDGFNAGSIEANATQSLKPKGTSKSMIMALTLVLAGMFAVIAVFIREFSSQVCISLRNEH